MSGLRLAELVCFLGELLDPFRKLPGLQHRLGLQLGFLSSLGNQLLAKFLGDAEFLGQGVDLFGGHFVEGAVFSQLLEVLHVVGSRHLGSQLLSLLPLPLQLLLLKLTCPHFDSVLPP